MKSFDLTKQYKLFKNINKKILEVLSSGSYILGRNVKSLKVIIKYLNTKYTVSCNSGTDALVMSLRALNMAR